MARTQNLDPKTVSGFGDEWSRFDQSGVPEAEMLEMFNQYFRVFPREVLTGDAVGFDAGCGTGRWARFVAPKVGKLYCIDASKDALDVAMSNLSDQPNCEFHHASIDNMPMPDGTMDFGYSLGVLHHIPRTAEGIRSCAAKLKPGAPLLVYIYYAFDNRPRWYALLWKASDLLRRVISRLPSKAKYVVATVIAMLVYLPLARLALLLEKFGFKPDSLPLAAYRTRSFYSLRTDAFDRFATSLEQRFTARQIRAMMQGAGLTNIKFSPSVPYWCAVGFKAQ